MTKINRVLTQFSHLLTFFWSDIAELENIDTTGSLKVDWIQANWEILVEGSLSCKNITLEPYGDGADCNGGSSRVLYPDRQPTYKLICSSLEHKYIYDILNDQSLDITENDMTFDRLVSIGDDGWYYELPPFDKVLGEYLGKIVVVDLNSIDINLRALK